MKRTRYALFLLLMLIFASCISGQPTEKIEIQDPESIAIATFDAITTATALAVPPTATIESPKPILKICLLEEPNTLMRLNSPNFSALQIIEAIDPSLVLKTNYQFSANYITELPSIENNRIVLTNVNVKAGDWIVDRFGNPVQLTNGIAVFPADCQNNSCVVIYDGSPLQMTQVSVNFTLKDGLFWNDGTLLTVNDSVFAYQIDQETVPFIGNTLYHFTKDYIALNEVDLQWTGIPGYLNEKAITAIWQPLPVHKYQDVSLEEMFNLEEFETILSWGDYQLNEWITGSSISLVPNEFSLNSENIFPKIEFLFVGNDSVANFKKLSSGECSILAKDTFSREDLSEDILNNSNFKIIESGEKGWVHLDFSLQNQTHDDGYNLYHDTPNYFENLFTREGIAHCIDRKALIELNYGSQTPFTYLSNNNPSSLFESNNKFPFDIESGKLKLDEAGWIVNPADNYRYSTMEYYLYNTKLSLNLFTDNSPQMLAAAEKIRIDLATCGVEVIINALPASEVYETNAEAPIFGRNFDLALFSWAYTQEESCWLYLSETIPGADKMEYPYYWLGWNSSGWKNSSFDQNCIQSMQSLSQIDRVVSSQEAQRLFLQELPVLPLYEIESLTAVRNDVCGYSPEGIGIDIFDFGSLGLGEYCK